MLYTPCGVLHSVLSTLNCGEVFVAHLVVMVCNGFSVQMPLVGVF